METGTDQFFVSVPIYHLLMPDMLPNNWVIKLYAAFKDCIILRDNLIFPGIDLCTISQPWSSKKKIHFYLFVQMHVYTRSCELPDVDAGPLEDQHVF